MCQSPSQRFVLGSAAARARALSTARDMFALSGHSDSAKPAISRGSQAFGGGSTRLPRWHVAC
jgi:hypothetical protein